MNFVTPADIEFILFAKAGGPPEDKVIHINRGRRMGHTSTLIDMIADDDICIVPFLTSAAELNRQLMYYRDLKIKDRIFSFGQVGRRLRGLVFSDVRYVWIDNYSHFVRNYKDLVDTLFTFPVCRECKQIILLQ